LFSNPLILLGVAAELVLMLFIVYTPTGNWLLGTAPVGEGLAAGRGTGGADGGL